MNCHQGSFAMHSTIDVTRMRLLGRIEAADVASQNGQVRSQGIGLIYSLALPAIRV